MCVSRETKMQQYFGLLESWNATINLLSDRGGLKLEAHAQDSLTLVPHLPPNLDRMIDLGSGQGFPAIPVAIETGIAVEMIEADRRKAAFLTTVLAKLALPGRVWATRIEKAALPPARCVTARALAPLHTLVELARPLLADGGVCLFLKGPAVHAELASSRMPQSVEANIIMGPNPASCLVKVTQFGSAAL